jgi:hypothetical protein
MNPDTIFKLAEAGHGLVTIGLAVLLFCLKRPHGRLLRGFLSVLAAWVSGILYSIYVRNPAGIAAGHYNGVHFPESHYDNNTIAVAIVAAWIGPAIIVAIMGAFRSMRDDVGLRSTERTREK